MITKVSALEGAAPRSVWSVMSERVKVDGETVPMYVATWDMATCFIVPPSFTTILSAFASAPETEKASELPPSMMLSSAGVAVISPVVPGFAAKAAIYPVSAVLPRSGR